MLALNFPPSIRSNSLLSIFLLFFLFLYFFYFPELCACCLLLALNFPPLCTDLSKLCLLYPATNHPPSTPIHTNIAKKDTMCFPPPTNISKQDLVCFPRPSPTNAMLQRRIQGAFLQCVLSTTHRPICFVKCFVC